MYGGRAGTDSKIMFPDIFYCRFVINGEVFGNAVVTAYNAKAAEEMLMDELTELGYGDTDTIKLFDVNPNVCSVQFVSVHYDF